jgi:hypothetical protein
LESCGNSIAYSPDKVTFASTFESLFKICNPLVKVEIERRRSCFDFEEPDWRSAVCATDDTKALRLQGG